MEMFLNLLMILGSLCQLHGLQMLHIILQRKAHISRNHQILASFASRINRKRLLLNKKRNRSGRSCWIKPGRTNAWWEKFLNNKVADTEWVENFHMSRSSFFDLVTIQRPYLQKQQTKMRNPITVKCQVSIFLYYFCDEGRYRKSANAFGLSRSSVSVLIRKVTKIIVKHLGPELNKLPKTVTEVEVLTENFLNAHGFPQCLGAIDGTHIRIKQPRENYTDYINRKGFHSINVQALCDYRYWFLDVVVKWPGSVHDSRIFLRSTVNNMLRNEVIPKCEKVIVDGEISVHVCILGDPAYPLLPFVMKEHPKGGKDDREKFFGYKL